MRVKLVLVAAIVLSAVLPVMPLKAATDVELFSFIGTSWAGNFTTSGPAQGAQIFDLDADAIPTDVYIPMAKTGNSVTVTVEIRNVSGGVPGMTVHCSGTDTSADLPGTAVGQENYELNHFPIPSCGILSAGNYALVMSDDSTSTNDYVHWRRVSTSPTFEDDMLQDLDGNETWDGVTATGEMEVFGDDLVPTPTPTMTPTPTPFTPNQVGWNAYIGDVGWILVVTLIGATAATIMIRSGMPSLFVILMLSVSALAVLFFAGIIPAEVILTIFVIIGGYIIFIRRSGGGDEGGM